MGGDAISNRIEADGKDRGTSEGGKPLVGEVAKDNVIFQGYLPTFLVDTESNGRWTLLILAALVKFFWHDQVNYLPRWEGFLPYHASNFGGQIWESMEDGAFGRR